MAQEIERKFLLASDAWREEVFRSEAFCQGYLGQATAASVRVRIEGEKARLNIKQAIAGPSRKEFEYPMPVADAKVILAELCDGGVLEKQRHWIQYDGLWWEIDEFEGENAPLVVAEIELDAVDQAFEKPAWLGQEVTDDHRYYNNALAKHPYSQWGKRS